MRYQQTVRTTNVTSGQAALEILGGPGGCRVFSVKIVSATGVATVLGLGRPAAMGDSPAAPTAFGSNDGGPASAAKVALAWGVSPTAPAAFFERVSVPAAVGFVRDMAFPQGIWIPAKSSLTLHNITGGAVFDVTVDMQESPAAASTYKDVVLADGPASYWRMDAMSYAQVVLADAAIGYWRMDAPSGTTETDRSAGAHNATYVSTITLNQAGALSDLDKAVAFTSAGTAAGDTGGYATAATAGAPGSTWSIELWIKRAGATDSVRDVVSLAPLEVYMNTGEHVLRIFNGAGTVITGAVVVDDGQWHHVVVVSDNAALTLKMYVDGAQDGATVLSSFNLTGTVLNFARFYGGGYTFGGSLDEVAIYGRALSAAQVAAHYMLRAVTEFDQSGQATPRNASVTGAGVTLNQPGAMTFEPDTAATFDGTDGTYVETNAAYDLALGVGPMSLEFWFKLTSALAQIGVVDDKDAGSTNAGFNAAFFAGVPFFRIGDNVGQDGINGSGVKNDGKWHHFVGVLTRGATDTLSLYIDGALDVSSNCTVSGRNISSTRKLRIGAYSTGGSPNFYIGTIDEVAVYSKVLTPAQIFAHFKAR